MLGAGDSYSAGGTGGEATHKLTQNEMPSHNHNQNARVYGYSGWTDYTTPGYCVVINQAGDNVNYHGGNKSMKAAVVTMTVDTNASGGGTEHNNMPPYLTVYMWKRVS